MNTVKVALVLAGMALAGCGDSGGGANTGSTGSKAGTTSKAATSSAAPATSSASTASATGSGDKGPAMPKACEDYFEANKKCIEKAVKAAGPAGESIKKSMDDAEKQMRDAWKDMEGPALESACKTAADAMAKNPACK